MSLMLPVSTNSFMDPTPHIERSIQASASATGLVSSPTPSTFTVTTSPAFERADARRRAGRDDIARLERHHERDELDQMLDPKDQLRGRRGLPPLAVDPASRRRADDPSAPTAMHGPIGANVSKPLQRVYCDSRFCRSRAVTSLTHVRPKM